MSINANQISQQELHAAARQPGAGVGAGIAVAVLTQDDALTAMLNEVVTADHTIAIAPDTSTLAGQIVATNAGVVLIDADTVAGDIADVLTRMRTQFPDLVLVAAGSSAHQSRLANMIAEGSVYRFLHKPVSAQRVRVFVDAALRRYDDLRGAAQQRRTQAAQAAASAATPVIPPRLMMIGAGSIAVLALVLWLVLGGSKEPTAPASSGSPGAASATPAATGTTAAPAAPLNPTQDRDLAVLLDRAEAALQANNIENAATLLAAAAKIQPDNARLTFLITQVSKSRERNALTQARSAAASGDYDKAFAALDAAGSADRTALSEAKRALSQQQNDEKLRGYLRLAQERLASGSLVEPGNDSARYYAAAARNLAPRDAGSLRMTQLVLNRVLQEARGAAGRADGAATDRWLAMAREDGASGNEIDGVRRMLSEARANQRGAEITRVATLARQRAAQDRLLEPADDSAQFWLEKLKALDGADATAQEVGALLAGKMVASGRAALASGDVDGAQRWLRSAEAAGRGAETLAFAGEISARQDKIRRDSTVIGVGSLKRTRFVEPTYPAAAVARKVSGWVDLEFTVRTDGTVDRIQITGAQPGGMFDDAARAALAKWRFEPVRRDGTVVEQRAKMRLRFNAPQ